MERVKTLTTLLVVVMLSSTVSYSKIRAGRIDVPNIYTSAFFNDIHPLEFIYTPSSSHDVIEVSKTEFTSCNTSNPIAVYNKNKIDKIIINLTKPGQRYFVSGGSEDCTQRLKLYVRVLDSPMPHPNLSTPLAAILLVIILGSLACLFLILTPIIIGRMLSPGNNIIFSAMWLVMCVLLLYYDYSVDF